MKYESGSPEETKAIAAQTLTRLTTNVIALHGPLGAGKTTFVQGIIESLGVQHRVTSPTFVLLRQYQVIHAIFSSIYHLDLYRVNSSADLKTVDLEEIVSDPHNLVLIEWAEKIDSRLPIKPLTIVIKGENQSRTITVKNQ